MKQRILITGAAGFIGSNLTAKILEDDLFDVVGLDNFSAPYGRDHCTRRANFLQREFGFEIDRVDLTKTSGKHLFELYGSLDLVIHLAAWPGVRYGQLKPDQYFLNNVNAFGHILDYTNLSKPGKFLFASSSSIYGDLAESGAVTEDSATGNNLRSFYAATKWSNEVLANSYQNVSGVPTIAMRFFTFYGPDGRPDMAYWNFLEKLIGSEEISLFGSDGGIRNFTFIDDAVEIMIALLKIEISGYTPINIASSNPITTLQLLNVLAEKLDAPIGFKTVRRPTFDVGITHADTSLLRSLIGDYQETDIRSGISAFVDWYKDLYLPYLSGSRESQ